MDKHSAALAYFRAVFQAENKGEDRETRADVPARNTFLQLKSNRRYYGNGRSRRSSSYQPASKNY